MELELKNIHKSFGEKEVLKGISFSASGGKAFGLLGRNGAGKTTTIRILMDVFDADGGEVCIDHAPIDYETIRLGYLPEERGLYPKKKIVDQLRYFAMLHGMKRGAAEQAIDYWLKRLDMYEYKNKRLDTLSKGNQQKIQLVTAIAHDPQIIILDEPFSGLDPVNAMLLKDVVKEEIAKGKIVLLSSHQMNYIEEFCDSIAILNDGEIVLHGDIYEIKHNYVRDKLVVRSEQAKKIAEDVENSRLLNEREVMIWLGKPEKKQEMMEHLAGTYDMDEMRVYEPSLNDIFVEYAGGQTDNKHTESREA